VSAVVKAFQQQGLNSKAMLVHHRLQIINADGEELGGELIGKLHESPLNLYGYAKRYKSILYEAAPTSGLSLNRNLAEKLFPIPERGIITSADDFVVKGASLIGELHCLQPLLGRYRIHGRNLWHGTNSRKSPEFIRTLDEFLNRKLMEKSLPPVLAFDDSMHSWGDLLADRDWKRLGSAMVKLSIRQHDRLTASYVLRIMRGIAGLTVRTALSKAGCHVRPTGRS
jgi:hypothetical protein